MAEAALRAKFIVSSIRHSIGNEGEVQSEEFEARAVYGDKDTENAQWSKWTPSGSLKLNITNRAAFNRIRVGTEFYLDLVPIEPAAPFTEARSGVTLVGVTQVPV